jgi:hypothetical protein
LIKRLYGPHVRLWLRGKEEKFLALPGNESRSSYILVSTIVMLRLKYDDRLIRASSEGLTAVKSKSPLVWDVTLIRRKVSLEVPIKLA